MDVSNTDVYDDDLNPVLMRASDDELGVLHDIIMTKLSETLSIQDVYKRYYPAHSKYSDLIAREVRDFGGNSIANLFRGEGPPYREIVDDVAKAVKAPFGRADDIGDVEASILATILSRAFEDMSETDRVAILQELGKPFKAGVAAGSAVAFQAMFKAGGFASYKLMLIVANAVVKGAIGRGLPLVANAALARVMGVATGPIGLAVTSLLAVIQVAGPSYKVTIPSVAYIAMLRKRQRSIKCAGCGATVPSSFRFCSECGAAMSGDT